jgi:selenide,water dikinase
LLCIGSYTHEESHIDLVKLSSFSSVRFIHAEACSLNTTTKKIMCSDGRPPISYDVLSIDIGITPKPLENGLQSFENITPVKPIDKFDARFRAILQRILEANQAADRPTTPFRVVVVGGGAGGCELCFALHYRLANEMRKLGKDPAIIEMTLATEGDKILSLHSRYHPFC